MAKLQSNNSCVLHFLAKCWDPEVYDFQAACWYKAHTKDGANPADPRCGESSGSQTVAIKRREVSNSRIVFAWIFRTFVWEMQHSTATPNGANSNLPRVTDPLLSKFVSHTCTASLLRYGDTFHHINLTIATQSATQWWLREDPLSGYDIVDGVWFPACFKRSMIFDVFFAKNLSNPYTSLSCF